MQQVTYSPGPQTDDAGYADADLVLHRRPVPAGRRAGKRGNTIEVHHVPA